MENSTIFSGEFNFHNTNKDLMVQYDLDTKTAVVLINRPKQLNAVNSLMSQELPKIWTDFNEDNSAIVAILSGSGNKPFSTGADLHDLPDMNDE